MVIKHKLAVVTGGAHRVGRAIVEALAAMGAVPVIHYHRSEDEARALARAVGGHTARADLSVPAGPGELVDQVLGVGGEVGVWVNSAALFERQDFLGGDDALWQRTLQLGLLSPAACVRRVAGHMTAGGLVVNVLDVAAHRPWAGYAHHCVAKAGLQMLTRSLAVELAPRLRVCGVSPGIVAPPREMAPPAVERLVRRVPLGRQGDPRDVGRVVQFLVEADYVTGAVVPVDGGLLAR